MPWKKVPCPTCGNPKSRKAEQCRQCKPTYARTPQTRAKLSAATKDKPKPWLLGRQRPQHSATMKNWWTPERRKAMAERLANPMARYHGLSSRRAAKMVAAAGYCQTCGHDGSESRLGVHHQDRDKHNQNPSNLMVLCHRCHMQQHAAAGETGWDVYHKKRKRSANAQTASTRTENA
jgi:hypothetical protein